MGDKKKTARLNITIPVELLEAIKEHSEKELFNIEVNDAVKLMLMDALKRSKK